MELKHLCQQHSQPTEERFKLGMTEGDDNPVKQESGGLGWHKTVPSMMWTRDTS